MGRRMDLEEFDDLFSSGRDFEITDAEYEERVRKRLPKTKSAIVGKGTPLGRKAEANGYDIHVEERPIIQRVVVLTKNDQ